MKKPVRQPKYKNYVSEVKCSNCLYKTRIKIPVGTTIDFLQCPKCGTKNLHHPSYFEEGR